MSTTSRLQRLLRGLDLLGVGVLALLRRGIRQRAPTPAPDARALVLASDADIQARLITMQGVFNFRDAGGYRTADGRTVRRGRVYRSGTLHGLTAADFAHLQALGIRLVCDLRGREELARSPDRLPAGTAYLHAGIEPSSQRRPQLYAMLSGDRVRLRALVIDTYKAALDQYPHVFGDILRRAADPEQLPLLIHCTAGKDRTGIAVALLLLALGVPEQTVIEDYTISNLAYRQIYEAALGLIRPLRLFGARLDDLFPLMVADAAVLRATLAHLYVRYGGVERYLYDAAGVTGETLAALRAHLLE